MNVVVGTS